MIYRERHSSPLLAELCLVTQWRRHGGSARSCTADNGVRDILALVKSTYRDTTLLLVVIRTITCVLLTEPDTAKPVIWKACNPSRKYTRIKDTINRWLISLHHQDIK